MQETSSRTERVADQIQRELATLIQMQLKDPRVGMVSVNGVKVSRDLTSAKVYVTVLEHGGRRPAANEPTQAPEETLQALGRASGFLRTMLSRRLRIASVPRLQFCYDHSIERGRHLSALIDHAIAADRRQAGESSANHDAHSKDGESGTNE